MATTFPTTIDDFTNITDPTVTTLQTVVGGRTHSDFHNDYNDALEAIQARVGVTNSAVPTSHEYKIATLETSVTAKADKTITISAGTGMTGGGDLSTNRTLTLANTAVIPGSYSGANITVDQQGRITTATNGTVVATDTQALVGTNTTSFTTSAHLALYDITISAGTTYTAGSAPTTRTITSPTYAKLKEIAIRGAGTYRVNFSMQYSGSNAVYGRIYKNGVAIGTERFQNSGGVVAYTEDFAFVNGDLVQIYAYYVSSSGGNIQAFNITYNLSTFNKYNGTVNLD